jgi:hypothetical protein
MSDVTTELDRATRADHGTDRGTDDSVSQYETSDGKPYADDFSNLLETRVAELRSICDAMDQRDEWGRMIEIIRCTLRRYFDIGQQHPYWNADAGQFQVGPSGATLGEEDENAEEFFEEEFNLYKAYKEIFIAVFSQTAAPSRSEPDKPTNGDSVKAAREAEKYLEIYQKYNPAKVAQTEVGQLMWTDGRILGVTNYETDEEKCGVDEDGNPLGAEISKYFGVLESKTPIIEPFKKWPYCKVSEDIDITVAQEDHPKIADQIAQGAKGLIPNNEIARISRIAVAEGIAQVSADTLEHLVTIDTWWLRRAAFRYLPKDRQAFWIGGKEKKEDGSTGEIPGIFPKGCRLKFIGTVFTGAKVFKANGQPVSAMDAQVKVMHTNPGTGNARGSKSDSMVPIQMEFNDAMGMYAQLIHKCIPPTYVNVEVSKMGAILEQISQWGQHVAFQPENGLPLSENIFAPPHADVPASFPAWIQNLQGPLSQQLANIQPAMFGGNMEDQKTAKAYQQARDMSLGVMAIVWVPYLEFASGIRWQAARLSAQREETQISVQLEEKDGKTRIVSVDTSVLGRGGFLCSPVTDQNFPESHTDKANKWLGIYQAAETNPAGFSAQLLAEPDNRVGLKDAIGLKLVMPGEQARDRQLAEWELMKPQKGGDGPIPDIEATQQKQQAKQQAAQQAIDAVAPGTPAPPVPPEPEVKTSSVPTRIGDDHIEHARTCRRILEGAEVWEMIDSAPEVVEDLILHMIDHLTKAQKAGIVIPPDLAGIIPPLPPPMLPGAPGATPGAPVLPGAAADAVPHPHPAKPAAGAPPLYASGALPLGGPSAATTV